MPQTLFFNSVIVSPVVCSTLRFHLTQKTLFPPLLPRATVIVSALRRHDQANTLRDGWLEEVQTV